jgi:hypothetical protein
MKRKVAFAATALTLALSLVDGSANAASAAVTPMAASESNCANSPSNGTCNGVHISTNGPCAVSSYVISSIITSDLGFTFKTSLAYSPTCKSNFAQTEVIFTGPLGYEFSTKVRRSSGPDGPYLMEHADWEVAFASSFGLAIWSPLVYSPDNTAQACFSNRSNDQVKCTAWF